MRNNFRVRVRREVRLGLRDVPRVNLFCKSKTLFDSDCEAAFQDSIQYGK